jgi:hypothetical protein
MIRDERQYEMTLAIVGKYRAALATREAAPLPENIDPRLHQAGLDAVRAQLDELERDLRQYEKQSGESGTGPESVVR